VRDFACPHCGQRLAFENSVCLSCSNGVGFDLEVLDFVVVDRDGTVAGDSSRGICPNLDTAGCNWVVATSGTLCRSCSLTRTRPPDGDPEMPAFVAAERAKRRLVVELVELGLPITDRRADPHSGLTFDLLSSHQTAVTTGHHSGVITLDLAEGDDVHREQLRISMDEPYRTLLGHFRHEIGHYYFAVLVESSAARQEFRILFGDPGADYQSALDRHYSEGVPAGWESEYVSSYATMHPAEDWAETFAHYLHIRDTVDTAAAFGFAPAGSTAASPMSGPGGFTRLVELWIPLAWALNMVNRSMGHRDLYPFALSPRVLDKMAFAHRLVTQVRDEVAAAS
jgi:hypothetical protein